MNHDNHNHHIEAAKHFEKAAEYHIQAHKLHESGEHEKETHAAYLAHGHHLMADKHANAAVEHHVQNHDGNDGHDNPDNN